MRRCLLILLLLPGLAGCIGTDSGCTVHVPALRAGASYLYDAEGAPRTLTVDSIGDWQPGDNGAIVLPKASTVQVTVADEPTLRLGSTGESVSALQVTYRATPSDERGPLDWADEWIQLETGQPIQVALRSHRKFDDGATEHFTTFGYADIPPLFTSGLFWDRELDQADQGVIATPGLVTSRGPSGSEHGLSWDVLQNEQEGGLCTSTVRLYWDSVGTGYGPGEIILRLADGRPLPLSVDIWWGGREAFTANLIGAREGNGIPVGPFEQTGFVSHAMTVPQEGFPTGPAPGFSMQFPEAVTAAEEDEAVRQWLSAHPDAALAQVEHRNGSPDGRAKDGWNLIWLDDLDHLYVRVVRNDQGLPLVEPAGDDVTVHPGASAPYLPGDLDRSWVSLDWLADRHKAMVGVPPEVIVCWALKDGAPTSCWVGTHAGTGRVHIDQPHSEAPRPGLLVLAGQGRLVQENSYDDRAIGPPVPHPDL